MHSTRMSNSPLLASYVATPIRSCSCLMITMYTYAILQCHTCVANIHHTPQVALMLTSADPKPHKSQCLAYQRASVMLLHIPHILIRDTDVGEHVQRKEHNAMAIIYIQHASKHSQQLNTKITNSIGCRYLMGSRLSNNCSS